MRIDFINNNFAGKISNAEQVKANINAATSCADVTKIFFAATKGIIPDYDIDHTAPAPSDNVTETQFRIDPANTSVWGITGTTINLILDLEKSGVFLRNDGTMSLRLILSDFPEHLSHPHSPRRVPAGYRGTAGHRIRLSRAQTHRL